MDIKQALKYGTEQLAKQKITSARLDAEVLLSFVLKKPREFLYAYPEKKLNTKCVQKFMGLIKKRSKHQPAAYLVNNKEFFKLNFYVDERVLIPRPETELLIENILTEIKPSVCRIAEIGTGSGCIAIALAKNCNCKIIATDICAKALQVARKNARAHNVLRRIKFLRGDLLMPLKNKKFDILIANLPYLANNYPGLKCEPQLALKAGLHGLDLYQKLLQQLALLKNKPNLVYFEIAHQQSAALCKIARKALPKSKIQIIKDLANLNRVLKIACE